MATRRRRPEPVAQDKIPNVEIEYARPPEDAKQNTKEPDRLATMMRCDEQGWQRGVVEGAAWALQLVRTMSIDEARIELVTRFGGLAEDELARRGI
jgi:hypothetical protein